MAILLEMLVENNARGLRYDEDKHKFFLARSCFFKWEFNMKQHKIILAKSSARELKRERTNKSQAINTRDTDDLFYRGSTLEGLVPVEDSTKDGSLSTLSLSQPIPKIGELSSSQGSLKTLQGSPHT
jgi:hypothetical protein